MFEISRGRVKSECHTPSNRKRKSLWDLRAVLHGARVARGPCGGRRGGGQYFAPLVVLSCMAALHKQTDTRQCAGQASKSDRPDSRRLTVLQAGEHRRLLEARSHENACRNCFLLRKQKLVQGEARAARALRHDGRSSTTSSASALQLFRPPPASDGGGCLSGCVCGAPQPCEKRLPALPPGHVR